MMSGMRTFAGDRRTFFVGLNTGYIDGGAPDRRMVAFYEERSSPGLTCAIVGNVAIPGGYGSNAVTPMISRDRAWKMLTSRIAARGTTPGIQLTTAWDGYIGATSFRPKDWTEQIARNRALASTVTPSRLRQLFSGLEMGTELAAEAGFRHIQLNAAHGYLFSLLSDARLYEGAADCLALVALWAEDCRKNDLETSLRISLRTGDERFDREGSTAFQDQASASPVDVVDVSSGYYNVDKRLIYPSVATMLDERRMDTASLASRHPAVQFILSGRASSAVHAFPANVHLGLCRDLIANPQFLDDPSRGCLNSGKCHYYSRGTGSVICPRWLN
jgi:2,4-dienoyl-CoA reductase-like NADH-dependent reductase (Old Yellow Enzyme family)